MFSFINLIFLEIFHFFHNAFLVLSSNFSFQWRRSKILLWYEWMNTLISLYKNWKYISLTARKQSNWQTGSDEQSPHLWHSDHKLHYKCLETRHYITNNILITVDRLLTRSQLSVKETNKMFYLTPRRIFNSTLSAREIKSKFGWYLLHCQNIHVCTLQNIDSSRIG